MKLSLVSISRRLESKSDADLSSELGELKNERRAFVRQHAGRIREDAYARVDAVAAEARSKFDTYLAANAGSLARLSLYGAGNLGLIELAGLWTAGYSTVFRAALHAIVDADTASFSAISGKDYSARVERFERDIREREVELERRQIAGRKEDAEREAAEALERLVAS